MPSTIRPPFTSASLPSAAARGCRNFITGLACGAALVCFTGEATAADINACEAPVAMKDYGPTTFVNKNGTYVVNLTTSGWEWDASNGTAGTEGSRKEARRAARQSLKENPST